MKRSTSLPAADTKLATPSVAAAGETAAARRPLSSVAVLTVGDTASDSRALVSALHALAVPIADEAAATLVVVVAADYLDARLRGVSRRLDEAAQPWMLVKPRGHVVCVGPVFSAATGACAQCLSRRLVENRADEVLARGPGASPSLSHASIPAASHLAIQLAATSIAQWLAGRRHDVLDRAVITLEFDPLRVRTHAVLRHARCERCGASARPQASRQAGATPLRLERRRKTFTADGGHRTQTPSETLARLMPFVSPLTGIMPDLALDDSGDGPNVYVTKHVLPFETVSRHGRNPRRRQYAAGKGATDTQGRVSCLAEAIERYSLGFLGDEPRVTARVADLGARAVDPRALVHFSSRQYEQRDGTGADRPDVDWVPAPFDETKAIEWTPAWSLTRGDTRWLPTAYCYFGYSTPHQDAPCLCDSNGCAAGSTLEEAILQGFLELVERDAVALWWYSRARRPAVDLDSFQDPFFDVAAAFCRERGRTLDVLDITSDLGIPAVAAASADADGGRILIGFGAHLDPRIAISRAVTEMIQMLPYVKQVERAHPAADRAADDKWVVEWIRHATLKDQPYLVSDRARVRTAADFPRLYTDDLLDDVHTCVGIAARSGLEVLVLDATRDDLPLSVVRVTVPGLRHFWPRFAPGRLYDVPVALGWVDRRLDESELNPIPCFL